jgi:hypothetical protein
LTSWKSTSSFKEDVTIKARNLLIASLNITTKLELPPRIRKDHETTSRGLKPSLPRTCQYPSSRLN